MNIDLAVNALVRQLELEKSDICSKPINETEIKLSAQQLIPAVETILDAGIWHLSTITCLQVADELVLLYHFWHSKGLTLCVTLETEHAQINSLTTLIPGAEFYEREVREMFGVEFVGLTNPSPLLLPDDWQSGFSMRSEKPNKTESEA
jgi:NADH:ubiquinone oxidoreductase subunit C